MSDAATHYMQSNTDIGVKEPVVVEQADAHVVVHLHGLMTTVEIAPFNAAFNTVASRLDGVKRITIRSAGITEIDTAGAWLLHRLRQTATARGIDVEMVDTPEDVASLVDAVAKAADNQTDDDLETKRNLNPFEPVGRAVSGMWRDTIAGLNILGAAVRGSQLKAGRGNRLNMAPVTSQIDRMGVRAIPIIVLMSSIIGAIIAQQGAFQLRYFGAEIFVVDLVGILVLREIGVLLTAIMIAGRSGSAITAEIGSMKMREEVDALDVIGLNPIGVLVFPRLAALVISLPLLTFIANMSALGGAMFVAQAYSGITPDAFISRVDDAIVTSDFFAGLIKAPFMAIIVGIIASVEGMKVQGSAESLGSAVTASVVKSIFVVIVVDGLFAIFFAAVDF
ncbi:MAG: ABC transporter permease [Pseudomonadota bacterium]